MKKTLIVLSVFICFRASAQHRVNIVPEPVSVTEHDGSFVLTPATRLVVRDASLSAEATYLNDYLQQYYGFRLPVSTRAGAGAITLGTTSSGLTSDEAYYLDVSAKGVRIEGRTAAGVFYALQSLIQILPDSGSSLEVPLVSIEDAPRFAYRGLHLDVGRHFFPASFVKKYIDLMAHYKYNTFHWHLTEDQGWRIEIKKYPLLTSVGSQRAQTEVEKHLDPFVGDGVPYGGFYTQDEIRDVVRYASLRHITVIPEIEMPGHALAALASYPYLGCTGGPYAVGEHWGVYDDVYCAGNDSVFSFIENVLDEVMTLFPSHYIHIGGDECPKVRWKTCPKCQKRMQDLGLKNEEELQSYFIQRIEKYVNSKGRSIIGWDEILEGGLSPNATVMSWRGEQGGIAAAQQHHDVIMTPGKWMYFDHYQASPSTEPLAIGGFLPVDTVYGYEPVGPSITPDLASYVLGAQGNVWTEYMKTSDYVEYMVYPRALALAEVDWTPRAVKNYDSFLARARASQEKLLKRWRVNYAKQIFQ
ncbi:MAG TPA: beta-N-acetylhexosaminidase [Dinghuibacter sp.]|uniref:beta-N-acetylhexosaminidase n=1 Tax=Dinghuibacter sp. TaxID=2024697 RepID=UPI002C2D6DE6|nr:beta-N-acetylhexosaminidase [Dinghuibacter sp.]HTJ10381.1 beta-N-acetylhexosaminidase [Dinghuibacter sp.]